MECTCFNDEMIEMMQMERIGKQRPDYNRFIKETLESVDEFLKNTSKSKRLARTME